MLHEDPGAARVPMVGELVAEKYEILAVLGEGAMGVVLSARHVMLGHTVAIKLIRPRAAREADMAARFLREARAVASLDSDHVVRILDFGVLPGDAPFMVMEALVGRDLRAELDARGPLPPAEAVRLVREACAGLSDAHALGIVHRDVKLSNLFLARRGNGREVIKILDFGIAKTAREPTEATLTRTEVTLGSARYMSPEQVRNAREVDARTDVWALGVVLFVLLTGKHPFEGDTFSAVCAAVAADTPPSIRSLRPELSEELEAVVSRCLEKNPGFRYATTRELSDALAPFAPADVVSPPASVASAPARPGESAPSRTAATDRTHSAWDGSGGAGRSGSPAPWLVGIGVLGVGVATWLILDARGDARWTDRVASPSAAPAVDASSPPVAHPARSEPEASASSVPAMPAPASTSASPAVSARPPGPARPSPRGSAASPTAGTDAQPAARPAKTPAFGGSALDDYR